MVCKWPQRVGGSGRLPGPKVVWVAAAKQPWVDPGEAPNISHRVGWRTNAEWITLANRNGNTGLVFLVSSSLDRPKSLHEPG